MSSANSIFFRSSPDKLVSSSLITRITLHNPLPRWAHAYALPFIPLYPFFAVIYFFNYDEYIGSEEWTFVYLGSLITIHALTWLCVQWSVNLEALFTATKVQPSLINSDSKAKSVRQASLVKVEPGPNQGKSEICKLEHVMVLSIQTRTLTGSFQMIQLRRLHSYSRRNDSSTMRKLNNSKPLSSLSTLTPKSLSSNIHMESYQKKN